MVDPEKTAALGRVRTIVVHPGLAHVDDIMACALAYAFGVPHDAVIERRKPSEQDLQDGSVLVLDVGFVHDPNRLDFDHHQRTRDDDPKCAYALFAEWLGVADELRDLFPWYGTWNDLDVLGPVATAARIGAAPEAIAGLVGNPLAEWVIRHFADNAEFRGKVALGLGKEIDRTRRCWISLREKARNLDVGGLPVADLRGCGADEVSRCSEAWARRHRPSCLVFRDNRGTGLTFLRHDDDPRLDFFRCAGRPYCLFAHPGGFILKSNAPDDDVEEVLRDARTR